jgi:hypothetical protein
MIATAVTEIVDNARDERIRRCLRQRGARHAIRTIDRVLWSLERFHVADRILGRRRVQALVARLSAALGRPAPWFVTEAEDSKALHAALLDWQDLLLTGAEAV